MILYILKSNVEVNLERGGKEVGARSIDEHPRSVIVYAYIVQSDLTSIL